MFAGPFRSWTNVKTEYGAVGDGITDDTAALQRALTLVGTSGHPGTLYLPPGVYRITNSLNIDHRRAIRLIGLDPSLVRISWDGPSKAAMMIATSVGESTFARITWDGSQRAGAAFVHTTAGDSRCCSSFANEHVDESFVNLDYGIRAGDSSTNDMVSETSVVRCQFIGNTVAAISIQSYNALDWWVWDSHFENCRVGVTNVYGAGNFMVYRSVFQNSSVADVEIGSATFFSLRNNLSIGSNRFVWSRGAGLNAISLTMQRNTIIDTKDDVSIYGDDIGPWLLIDNVIRSRRDAKGPAIQHTGPFENNTVSLVGNQFTMPNPIVCSMWGAAFSEVDTKIVSYGDIPTPTPAPLRIAPRFSGKVFEAPVSSNSAAIQKVIDEAVRSRVPALVHLPEGNYRLDQTLHIPANADVTLAGDGSATYLTWVGATTGTMIAVTGPTHFTARDLYLSVGLDGTHAISMIGMDNIDQPGARVFSRGVRTTGGRYSLLSQNLGNTKVEMRGFLFGNAGTAVSVSGSGTPSPGSVNLVGAATGLQPDKHLYDVSHSGRLLVEDTWADASGSPLTAGALVNLRDTGTFTLLGGMEGALPGGEAPIVLDGFEGYATFGELQGLITAEIRNEQSATNSLFLCVSGMPETGFQRTSAQLGTVARIHGFDFGSQGISPITNQGQRSGQLVRESLQQARTETLMTFDPLPRDVTDIQLYGLALYTSDTGLRLTGDSAPATRTMPFVSHLYPGQQQQFRATEPVRWSVTPAVGTITGNGLYTAPADGQAQTVVIQAASASSGKPVAMSTVQLLPKFDVLRIAAGSDVPVEAEGVTWSADSYGFDGASYSLATWGAIQNAPSPLLYTWLRYGAINNLNYANHQNDVSYYLPVPAGKYRIKLYFSETYYAVPGKRVMDISVNGSVVIHGFDPVALVGKNVAVTQEMTVDCPSNLLTIRVSASSPDVDQSTYVADLEVQRLPD